MGSLRDTALFNNFHFAGVISRKKKTSLRFSSSCPLIVHAVVSRVAHLHADGVHMVWHPISGYFPQPAHETWIFFGTGRARLPLADFRCSKELEVPSNFIHRNFIEMCNSWDGHLNFCPRSKHWAQFLESKRRPSWRFCDLSDLKRKMKDWFQAPCMIVVNCVVGHGIL